MKIKFNKLIKIKIVEERNGKTRNGMNFSRDKKLKL